MSKAFVRAATGGRSGRTNASALQGSTSATLCPQWVLAVVEARGHPRLGRRPLPTGGDESLTEAAHIGRPDGERCLQAGGPSGGYVAKPQLGAGAVRPRASTRGARPADVPRIRPGGHHLTGDFSASSCLQSCPACGDARSPGGALRECRQRSARPGRRRVRGGHRIIGLATAHGSTSGWERSSASRRLLRGAQMAPAIFGAVLPEPQERVRPAVRPPYRPGGHSYIDSATVRELGAFGELDRPWLVGDRFGRPAVDGDPVDDGVDGPERVAHRIWAQASADSSRTEGT